MQDIYLILIFISSKAELIHTIVLMRTQIIVYPVKRDSLSEFLLQYWYKNLVVP